MKVSHLGHVVLYVRDLQRSLAFYCKLLGLVNMSEPFGGRAAMLTSNRTHHELLLIQVGDAPGPMRGHRIGLYHIGWCIGNTSDELVSAIHGLREADVTIDGTADHWMTQSVYVRDPDGNEVELYVDVSDYDWQHRIEWLTHPVKPLAL